MGLLNLGRKGAAKAAEPAVRTFQDYLSGVAKVHKEIAKTEGAQRIDPKLRASQKGMTPGEVLQQYNENRLFGTTTKGEPIVARMQSLGGADAEAVAKGLMPKSGRVGLFRESQAPDVWEGQTLGPKIGFYHHAPERGSQQHAYDLYEDLIGKAQQAGKPIPYMYGFNAMDVKPIGVAGWWNDLPAKGKDMYSLMYDMTRAGGHGNYADTLTSINAVRRLGNVASHQIGHGGLGHISPINEELGYSTQLLGSPLRGRQGDAESEYLHSLFLSSLRPGNTKVVGDLLGLKARDLSNLTDEEKLGMMLMRESQMSSVYGPPTMAGTDTRYAEIKPWETGALRDLAGKYIAGNEGELSGAFGPHTLGRQVTTEETVRRLMQGMTPEEISYDLISKSPIEGFRGRYKKGGLVRAAIES